MVRPACRGWALFVGAVLLLCVPAIAAEGQQDPMPPISESTLQEVERYLETQLSEVGRPGLTAAVVQDGEVVFSVALGDAAPGVPMTIDTPLFIASVSKSITAMTVMKLVEAGRVDLDAPLTVYLPELGPEGDGITVADLMHQRSGLSRYVGNEPWAGDLGSSLEANVLRLAPHLRAGSSYSYSNANYDALALIVQRVSGVPFGEYVATEVFGPLAMTQSFVGPNTDRRDVATGHYRQLFLGYRPYAQPDPLGMAGSAVMYSTAEDLGRFLIAHLEGGVYDGSRVVSEASVQRLHHAESMGFELPDDYPIDDVGYGGGLVVSASFGPDVDPTLARMVTLRHDGDSRSYRAMMWMIPDVDVGFVVLSNGSDLSDSTWLPQVAQGVKHLLFGLDPPAVVNRSSFLMRYAKQLLVGLVAVQVALVGPSVRALRRRERRWYARALITAATIVDLTALIVIVWVIPAVSDAPLRLALLLPDMRILIGAMAVGVLWGGYRTYAAVKTSRRR